MTKMTKQEWLATLTVGDEVLVKRGHDPGQEWLGRVEQILSSDGSKTLIARVYGPAERVLFGPKGLELGRVPLGHVKRGLEPLSPARRVELQKRGLVLKLSLMNVNKWESLSVSALEQIGTILDRELA